MNIFCRPDQVIETNIPLAQRSRSVYENRGNRSFLGQKNFREEFI